MKKGTKRNLRVLLAVLVFTLTVSVIWAATSGMLSFSGTVELADNVDLDIQYPTFSGTSAANWSGTLSNGNNTYTFAGILKNPGERITLTFNIANVGSIDAQITSVNLTSPAGDLAGKAVIGGTYPSLNLARIPVGGSNLGKTVTVTWDSAALNAIGTDTFAVAIDYVAAY